MDSWQLRRDKALHQAFSDARNAHHLMIESCMVAALKEAGFAVVEIGDIASLQKHYYPETMYPEDDVAYVKLRDVLEQMGVEE